MVFRTMHKSRMILTDSKKCEIVCFLLGNYPVSEILYADVSSYLPAYEDGTDSVPSI